MKKLLCLLFVLVFLPVVSFAADKKPIEAHYTAFVDESATYGSKGSKIIDYDSLCLDLYIVEGREEGYLLSVRSFLGLIVSSGTIHVDIAERNGVFYLADDNGNYITASPDENGDGIWLEYEGLHIRLRPVPSASPYGDIR